MPTPHIKYIPKKGIPLYKRIPFNQVRQAQPARHSDFDIPVHDINYPLSLHLEDAEEGEKPYLYHEKLSFNGSLYREVVWQVGTVMVMWDDTLHIPVILGYIRSIDGADGSFYLNVTLNKEEEILEPNSRHSTIMESLLPLWSPEETWWEFKVNMDVSMARKVHRALLTFISIDPDDYISIAPTFRTLGRKYYHTVDYCPAFTYRYANYPNEKYALKKLVDFIRHTQDLSPTHGGWGDATHMVVKKSYDIELRLNYTDTINDDEYGEQDFNAEITVPLTYIKAGKYALVENIKYKWDDIEGDSLHHDTDEAEEVIWQQLESSICRILVNDKEKY